MESTRCDPSGQTPQLDAPSELYVPTSHCSHAREAFAPIALLHVPAWHGMHDAALEALLHVPAGHCVHAGAPALLNAPAGHGKHADDDIAPMVLLHVPAGHPTQADDAALLHVPAEHNVQDEAPALLHMPAAHSVHTVAPALLQVPAGHIEHEKSPTLHPAVHARTQTRKPGAVMESSLTNVAENSDAIAKWLSHDVVTPELCSLPMVRWSQHRSVEKLSVTIE